MALRIQELTEGRVENHILPFFWQHGEDPQTLRTYMRVIHDANCGAVCVESRPHPDFCGEKWWADMDVILDEARKLDMKVWILDDSHFPTGFANGAVQNAPADLQRRSIYCRRIHVKRGQKKKTLNFEKIARQIPTTTMGSLMNRALGDTKQHWDDDKILDISAEVPGECLPVPVKWEKTGNKVVVTLPENARKLYVSFTTRNAGIHRSYINMLDAESCRIQIDAVYEPHYAHYKEYFGNTIAGFFSDEPELGNGVYFKNDIAVGSDFDYPWSRQLEARLAEKWGEDWKRCLPLLWDEDTDETRRAKCRYDYMDAVTRLVESCFSQQLGSWCQERGVRYIGHMIEDGNQHGRMGASLGHFFRGLSGQHMAGIDDIGGQVLPQKEDAPAEGKFKLLGGRDGEFYHYLLGKLGASDAAIDPKKRGNAMCEIFGNYGWSEGPRMEKFLADHFMVQGINYYVPHAFSAKAYPDPDCPPHFYAHGHNPQYRHFGQLMAYMNRVCSLICDGRSVVHTAVLYHGDCEWSGDAMLSQKVTRVLMENQIDCHVIPADVFEEPGRYQTQLTEQGLLVNGNWYDTLIVPGASHIPPSLSGALESWGNTGCKVLFVDRLPAEAASGRVVSLAELPGLVTVDMALEPAHWRLRTLHYRGAEEIFYLVNEDDKPYSGTLTVPRIPGGYRYDAWENKTYPLECTYSGERTRIPVTLEPGESWILAVGTCGGCCEPALPEGREIKLEGTWRRSVCKASDYPHFTGEREITAFGDYGREDKRFSGFIAYETEADYPGAGRTVLEIRDAGEDVEVFVNGVSAGIQVLPPFRYDISGLLQKGRNTLRIEVATTLERERNVNRKNWAPIGILGPVCLYYR